MSAQQQSCGDQDANAERQAEKMRGAHGALFSRVLSAQLSK
jgi:hypothetical protein